MPCSDADHAIFASASLVVAGDGRVASFWMDNWTTAGTPFILFPALYAVSRCKRRSLREAVEEQRWVQDLRGRITTDLLPTFVQLWQAAAALNLVDGMADAFSWRCTDSGSFSVASAYRLQFAGSLTSPLLAPIWRAWAPAKHRLLAWLMVQNRVLTADRLMARQWPNCYFCQLCIHNLETAEHLLIECPWS